MHKINVPFGGRNARTNVEISRLEAQLKIIENEEKDELRMHNSEAQRLHAKFSKTTSLSDSFSKAAGIKMYQTHNPGFCYKRNGVHKTPQKTSTVPVMDFQELRSLVFTNNELDIEKILCLHMISTHCTDSLKMPSLKLMNRMSRVHSPLERLLHRSKRINKEKREDFDILKVLPIYIIDIAHCLSSTSLASSSKEEQEEHLYKDARLNNRLLVNGKLEEVLVAALEALEKSKSEKYKRFIEYSKDTTYLKKIFSKQSTQDFLKMLKSYSIITSPESYYLTPKSKNFQPVHLEIRTIFGHLESMLYQIRKNVLQLPSKIKNEWKCIYEFDENALEDDGLSVVSQLIYDGSGSSRSAYVKKSTRSIISKVSSLRQRSGILENQTPSMLGKRAYKNFVRGNIAAVKGESVTRKLFENFDEEGSIILNTNLSEILSQDYFPPNLKHYALPANIESEVKPPMNQEAKDEETSERFLGTTMSENSSFIRKTNCCACQVKWKQPLPSPKIPRYKRAGLPADLYENPFKTNRFNQLSSMIHEELYNLNSYDTRYSLDNLNVKIKFPKNVAPSIPKTEDSTITDSVQISPYDLAKISHEIADRETDKKLDEFLEESI